MSLHLTPVLTSTHYQFTAPPGVYWLGDPARMVPGHLWEDLLNETDSFAQPEKTLPNEATLLAFPAENVTPSGYVGMMRAPEGECAPSGTRPHAFFGDVRVAVREGVLVYEDHPDLPEEDIDPRHADMFFTDKVPVSPAFANLVFATKVNRYVNLPAGTYWVGDPAKNFDLSTWSDILNMSDDFYTYTSHAHDETIIAFPTTKEDARFTASDGNHFPVNSGYIGVMEARRTPSRGGMHSYVFPRTTRFSWEDGVFKFDKTTIDTNPAPYVPAPPNTAAKVRDGRISELHLVAH